MVNKNDNKGSTGPPEKSRVSIETPVIELDSDSDEEKAVNKPNTSQNAVGKVTTGAVANKLSLSETAAAKRIAKKSTASPHLQLPPAAATRRQSALAKNIKKPNNTSQDKFLENFNPESSARERRKLTRKVNAITAANTTRKQQVAVYNEKGIHIASGIDLCDCFHMECPGCHYECPTCNSKKCGPDCRCNRKFVYEVLEYHGCDFSIKNPFNK